MAFGYLAYFVRGSMEDPMTRARICCVQHLPLF